MSNRDQIDERTSLPFKIVVPICTTVLLAGIWLNNSLNRINSGLDRSWKASEQQIWADRLQKHNSNIRVPSVEEIRSGSRDYKDTVDAGPTLGLKQ